MGEMGFFTSHSNSGDNSKIPDIKDSTPYKTASHRYTISIYGEWEVKSIPNVKETKIRGIVDWIKGDNDNRDL